MHVGVRDHRVGLCRRRPALGPPAGRRNPVAERADHHEHEIDHAHRDEGFPDADRGRRLEIVHQQVRQRRADHRAAAKAHDRHAGGHAAPVREPFHQRRHRRDVAEAEADAADHAGAEPEQPKLMRVDADRAEEEATAPADRRHEAGLAGPDTLEPAAPYGSRDAEQHKEQRVHPAHARDLPVASGGEEFLHQRHVGARLRRIQPERTRQRQPEHAEPIGHAYAEMNAQRCRRHQPAIEAGGRDGSFLVEDAGRTGRCERNVGCRHRYNLQIRGLTGTCGGTSGIIGWATQRRTYARRCDARATDRSSCRGKIVWSAEQPCQEDGKRSSSRYAQPRVRPNNRSLRPLPSPNSLKREVSNPRAKSHDAENQSLNQKLRAPMDKMSGASPDILSNQFASGSQMRNVLPEPISLSTVIWPRCRFTSV